MAFIWIRLRTSHAHGYGQWEYKEVNTDDWSLKTVHEIVEDVLQSYDDENGDGIRASQGELIERPPVEWCKKRATRNFEKAAGLLDQRDRLLALINFADSEPEEPDESHLPWSVGEDWTGKLLKKFATEQEASEWLGSPTNPLINPTKLNNGDYWLVGPADDDEGEVVIPESAIPPEEDVNASDCASGLHSWVEDDGLLSPDTPCAFCGETYGDLD